MKSSLLFLNFLLFFNMSNSLNYNPLTKELTTDSITKELTTESITKELTTESITKETPLIDFFNDYDINFPYLIDNNDKKNDKKINNKKNNNKINDKKSIITDSYIKTIKLNTTNVLILKGIINEKNTL